MATFRTIYENGVLRPLDPVDLPEGCRLRFENWRVVGQDKSGISEYEVTAVILGVAAPKGGVDSAL